MIPATRRRALVSIHALLLMVIAPLAGCELPFGTGTPDTITSLPRSLTGAEERTIRASNRFGFRLLQEVHEESPDENHVLSPLSASMALGMALNGADGRTFEAMRETLGFSGAADLAAVNESYAGLIGMLQDLDPRVDFLLANSVWLQTQWPFLPAYEERVTEAFDARVQNVDFTDPATADAVNGWVSEGTNGRITEFVTPEQLRGLVALLANTVFFEGEWSDRFDESDTSREEFRLADGSTVSVPMMSQTTEEVGVARAEGVRAADLPYGERPSP